jgi:hypothetical protein
MATRSKKSYGRRVSGRKGTCDRRVVQREMRKWKAGKLRSGSGKRVTDQRQAVAIALSSARRKCPGRTSKRRTPARKGSRHRRTSRKTRRKSR